MEKMGNTKMKKTYKEAERFKKAHNLYNPKNIISFVNHIFSRLNSFHTYSKFFS